MKVKVLAGLLCLSILVNIAGLVFFILFLSVRGEIKALKRDKSVLERNLAVFRSANLAAEKRSEGGVTRVFVSEHDREQDSYAFMPPSLLSATTDNTLVLYLHGMGSNFMEPFVNPGGDPVAAAILSRDPSCGIISPSYRKLASWGNDSAISDINQNVRAVLQEYPFKRIVVVGTSMGGCTALNYAASAPEDIKSRIVGVVSAVASGDLLKLYNETCTGEIRNAMIVAFHARPDQNPDIYKRKSVLNNLDRLPKSARFFIVSAKEDKVVPTSHQIELNAALEKSGFVVKMESVEGGHQMPAGSVYSRAIDFVLGRS